MKKTDKKYDLETIFETIDSFEGVTFGTPQSTLTYADLSYQIRTLSKFLKQHISPGAVVAITGVSSPTLNIAFLGVLNAGGVALLIDSSWSKDWQDVVRHDAQPEFILTPQNNLDLDFFHEQSTNLCLFRYSSNPTILDNEASYLIYTSGTTGKPKGVINSIEGLTNLFHAVQKLFKITPSDAVLQFSSPSFDAWIWDMCLAFSSGAKLVIPDYDRRLPGNGLEELVRQHSVTVMTLPPSVLYHCRDELSYKDVRILITAGERCPKDLVEKWLTKDRELFNAYGPSEAAVCATIHKITNEDDTPPIGKAISGVEITLQDENGDVVIGEGSGEMIIAGHAVGLGYINRPELTHEKFTTNPRTFKTGDVATRHSDGNLYFEGRIDRQVKIDGIRLELEHVEKLLESHPHTSRVFVTDLKEDTGGKKLVAFVVQKPDIDTTTLRGELIDLCQKNLPLKVKPLIFFTPDLPVRGSGKVDLNALIAKYLVPQEIHIASDDLCLTISNVFKQYLGLQDIGVDDDFFALGGSSLGMIQCIEQIEHHSKTHIPIFLAMRYNTARSLTKAIEECQKGFSILHEKPITEKDIEELILLETYNKKKSSQIDTFVTGGTGLLGAYTIHELLERTIGKIYCLVRAASDEDAYRRIVSNLEKRNLWKPAYETRIVCLAGNLERHNFGFSEPVYNDISENIGYVYHIAANVSWVLSYNQLEASNVIGTKNAITLAYNSGAQLAYVSSIGVHHTEGWQKMTEFNEEYLPSEAAHLLGYLRTKWVSEKLVIAAGKKYDVPYYIFRPPFICEGVGVSGTLAVDDFLFNKIQACISLGCVPNNGFYLDIYPADVLAKNMISIVLQQKFNKVFQFTNPQKLSWHEAVQTLKGYGYNLEELSYDKWLSRLSESKNQLSDHLPFLQPINSLEKSVYEHYHGRWPKVVDSNVRAVLKEDSDVESVQSLLQRYV